jgi:hypothetical protein
MAFEKIFSSYLIKSCERRSAGLLKMLEPSLREYERRGAGVTMFSAAN